MPDILVQNVSPEILEALKRRAARAKRSLQEELRAILERAALARIPDPAEAAERIRQRLASQGFAFSDSSMLIRGDREQNTVS